MMIDQGSGGEVIRYEDISRSSLHLLTHACSRVQFPIPFRRVQLKEALCH
jgi:hypothetical protein